MASRVGLPYRIRAPLQWVGRNNKPSSATKALAADSIGEETWSPLQAPNYLRLVLTSKVYEAVSVTPLQHAPTLSASFGNNVYLKREDMTPGFSFKLRGVFNRMSQLSPEEKENGVVTYSTGNHGFATARAASQLGVNATIVMPTALPPDRYRRVSTLGAKVHQVASSSGTITSTDAMKEAQLIAQATGAAFIHPFDDPLVIAGNGTVGMEIVNQFRGQSPIDAVFVCCGGGGLLAGVAAYIKAVTPWVKVIGVEGWRNDAMTQSLNAGRRISIDEGDSNMSLFAEGASCPKVGEETFRVCNELVDDMVVVTNDEICAAIENGFEETRAMLEPAGALALAGMKKYIAEHSLEGHSFVAVTSGANMKFDRLRFVAERSLIGEGREALLSVVIPERPGAFKQLYGHIYPRNVTEFSYRAKTNGVGGGDTDGATIFISVATEPERPDEVAKLVTELVAAGFDAVDLSSNEMAKSHTRYLVGGRPSACIEGERLYRFEFPERPGALKHFLDCLHQDWAVTLFHYRNHGTDVGKVLAGITLPTTLSAADQERAWTDFLSKVGFVHTDETNNAAALFVQ